VRRIINSLSFFLVLGFLLFLDVPLSSAAKIEGLPPPKQPYLPDTTVEAFDYLKGSVFPHESSDIITENTGTVKITFDGLVSGESYKLCLGGLCTAQFHGDISESKIVGAPPTKDVGDDAQIEVKVCADGRQRLKIYDEGEGDCKDEDYFHGRQI
jgi:hypothetical protein